MRWIFKTFWSVITVGMALLGLVYLPVDYLDRERAMEIFWRTASVGNREILLVALCILAICRIFYLELRQGTQGPTWQPIRKSLLRGLSALFKRDKRIAELKTLGDHPELQRILDSGRAREVLQTVDWNPIVMLDHVDFSDVPDNMMMATYKMRVTKPLEILMNKMADEIKIMERNFGDIDIFGKISEIAQKRILIHTSHESITETVFVDENHRQAWLYACHSIGVYNQIKDRVKTVLKQEECLWVPQRANEASSRLNQSLRGIVAEIQQ